MIYGDSIQETRSQFFNSWDKFKKNLPLTPFEDQIVSVIRMHPEYHAIFDNPDNLEKNFQENNPFLHLGMHLALRDQIAMNRPAGIQQVYQQLLQKRPDPIEVEHKMMEKMAVFLYEMQKTGKMPDEQVYLKNLQTLL